MEETKNCRHAVIDVGSNTIRTVIYALDKEARTAKGLISDREFAGIIAYVKDGRLSEAGQLLLIDVLTKMKEFCALAECREISCFSTASLRGAENLDEVIARVRSEVGVEIRPLSAEEETLYDLDGLRSAGAAPEGTGLDLGGGSCQIFRYGEGGFQASVSLKIGCLTLSDECVGGIFPTKSEARKIRQKVRRALSGFREEMRVPAGTFICAMGGTARAAARVFRALSGAEATESPSRLSREALDEIIELSRKNPKKCIRLLSRAAPARMHTLIAGAIVLRTICKTLGADGVEVVPAGIREGFLRKEVLGGGEVVPAKA